MPKKGAEIGLKLGKNRPKLGRNWVKFQDMSFYPTYIQLQITRDGL